jgi:hypothetical protein
MICSRAMWTKHSKTSSLTTVFQKSPCKVLCFKFYLHIESNCTLVSGYALYVMWVRLENNKFSYRCSGMFVGVVH